MAKSRACCTQQLAGSDQPDASRSIADHHCRSLATYEVIPATTVNSHAGEHVALCGSLATALIESSAFEGHSTAPAPGLDAHPPDDLVVVLHRLVI